MHCTIVGVNKILSNENLYTLTKKVLCQSKFFVLYQKCISNRFCDLSRESNIAFLLDLAQMSDLHFGLIQGSKRRIDRRSYYAM